MSSYGAAVLPLLLELQHDGKGERDGQVSTLVKLARTQASHYPDFLSIAHGGVEPLTEAELQVLRLVCAHKSNAEICEILGIKLPTVKTHVSHILAKLSVSRRSQAAERARSLHLV